MGLVEDDDSDYDEDIFNKEHMARKRAKVEAMVREKLRHVDTRSLSHAQKQLVLVRVKLLKYLDRLNLYEQILGGPVKAADLFCAEQFQVIFSNGEKIYSTSLPYHNHTGIDLTLKEM